MQTFAILMVAALYGWRLGTITVLAWLGEAAVGMPVLAGGAGGIAVFVGPTAGYILSWPLITALVGWLFERGWNGHRPALPSWRNPEVRPRCGGADADGAERKGVTVRLRAHHLLCVLTYVGKGYSPALVANCDRVAARISAGEYILLVAGPDDICAPLLNEAEPHCNKESATDRDARAAEVVARSLGQPLQIGVRLRLDSPALARLRAGFAGRRFTEVCAGCSWSELCASVARDGYADVRIRAKDIAPNEIR